MNQIGIQLIFMRLPLFSEPVAACPSPLLVSPAPFMKSSYDLFLDVFALTFKADRPRADLLLDLTRTKDSPNESKILISSGLTKIVWFCCCMAMRLCSSSIATNAFGKKLWSHVLTMLNKNSRSMNLSAFGLLSGKYSLIFLSFETFSKTVRTLS